MRILIAVAAFVASTAIANADCRLVTDPCQTDRYGNTYRTEKNLGGNYTTYRNGMPHSTTSQTLGGTWQERNINSGATRTFNYDPYGSNRKSNYYGYR